MHGILKKKINHISLNGDNNFTKIELLEKK